MINKNILYKARMMGSLFIFLMSVLYFFPLKTSANELINNSGENDDKSVIVGWGVSKVKGDSDDDLQSAVSSSRDRARDDLSKNIISFIQSELIDVSENSNGKRNEFFKEITVNKVMESLREVNLDEPEIASGIVKSRAWVSLATARLIADEAFKQHEISEQKKIVDLDEIQTLTSKGAIYFKKIVYRPSEVTADALEQEESVKKSELVKSLVEDNLKDFQDVRDAIVTKIWENVPDDGEVTMVAYIDKLEYNEIIKKHDDEVFKYGKYIENKRYLHTNSVFDEDDPKKVPQIAETYLPSFDYTNFVGSFSCLYAVGNGLAYKDDFSLGLKAIISHDQEFWGFEFGTGIFVSLTDTSLHSVQDAQGNTTGNLDKVALHIPFEVDGKLVFSTVKSDSLIPYVKIGEVVYCSILTGGGQPGNGFTTFGETVGMGLCSFRKQGISLRTLTGELNFAYFDHDFFNNGAMLTCELSVNYGF